MGDPKGTEVVDDLGEILNQEVVFQEETEVLLVEEEAHQAEEEVLLVEVDSKVVVFQEVNQALVEIEIVEIANHQVAVATEEEVGNKLKEELIKIKNGN